MAKKCLRGWMIVLLAMLAGLPGCGEGDGRQAEAAAATATLDGAAVAARAVLERTDAMAVSEGGLQMGDATAAFRAWYERDTLRAVAEEVDQGDYGRAEARYVLVGGELAWYESQGTLTATDPARAGQVDTVRWRAAFDAGELVAIEKTVNGAPAEPEAWKEGEIRRRLVELARAAQALGG